MSYSEITPEAFHTQLQSGKVPLLLDVRNNQTFNEWNIFTSRNIPIMRLLETEDFPKDFHNQEIVVICSRGQDSLNGARYLQNLGINARSLQGGLLEWNNVFDTIELINEPDLKLLQIRRIAKGCLSYLLFSNREAIVIDPAQNISPYIRIAEEKDLSITQVIDSHLHVDHISGVRALANETGAEIYLNPQDPYKFEFNTIIRTQLFGISLFLLWYIRFYDTLRKRAIR